MTKLQKLALEELVRKANELDRGLISLGNKITGINRDTDLYPLNSHVRSIINWAEAIKNNDKE